MSNQERRFFSDVELRATQTGEATHIRGYAATYASSLTPRAQKAFGFNERIKPGAFDRALRERQDCMCLVNHDQNQLLGRVSSGTLRLRADSKGLNFECTLPPTQSARD